MPIHNIQLSTVVFGFSVLLMSCTTTKSATSIDELVTAGGEIVEFRDLIGDTGVTSVGTDGGWYSYLSADGRKVVKIRNTGVIKELTWRVNEADEFCQQMFATEKEACNTHVIIRDKDGIYNSYNKGDNKPGFPFTIVSGNPEGL